MTTYSKICIVLMLFAFAFTIMAKIKGKDNLSLPLKMLKSFIFFGAGIGTFNILVKADRNYIPFAVFLLLGLVCGVLGDFFLGLRNNALIDERLYMDNLVPEKRGNFYFKLGMFTFLIGHIFYIISFQKIFKFGIKHWVIALVVMFGLFILLWIIESKLKFLKINLDKNENAVYIYNIVLSVLVGLILGEFLLTGGTPISKHLLASIALFYISDFILLFCYFTPKKKKFASEFLDLLNHGTYFAAQLGIALLPLFFI